MTDGKKLDFNLPESPIPKPDKAAARKVAAEAGAAEGFTARTPAQASVENSRATRRAPKAQLNFKVPQEFLAEFLDAYHADAAVDRSIRSAGEFLEKVFSEWKKINR